MHTILDCCSSRLMLNCNLCKDKIGSFEMKFSYEIAWFHNYSVPIIAESTVAVQVPVGSRHVSKNVDTFSKIILSWVENESCWLCTVNIIWDVNSAHIDMNTDRASVPKHDRKYLALIAPVVEPSVCIRRLFFICFTNFDNFSWTSVLEFKVKAVCLCTVDIRLLMKTL